MKDRESAPAERDPGGAVVPDRRFGDEAVARILKRATELQEQQSTAAGGGSGLTLAELRVIASEAGIDPRFIDQAASDESMHGDDGHTGLAGATYSWSYRRRIAGEIADEDLDVIVQAIRSVLGHKGELTDVFGRMEWSNDDGLGPVIVGVTSRDGETVIDVSARRSGLVGLLYGLVVPMGGILGGAALLGILGFGGPALALPTVAGMAGLSYIGVRSFWRVLSDRWERRMLTLLESVTRAAVSVAEQPALGARDDPA